MFQEQLDLFILNVGRF